jgi:hypothetical protein
MILPHYFHRRTGRAIAAFAGLLSLCLVCGCYERAAQGNQSVYRFAWWLGPIVIGGGILSVPIGWLLRTWSKKWGFAILCLGPVMLAIVAPAMYSDRVVIDDDHFEAKYGLWFSPTQQSVRFRDLNEIRYVGIPGRRGRMNYELRCMTPAGQVIVVPAGDLVRQTVPEILQKARARRLAVVNEVQ